MSVFVIIFKNILQKISMGNKNIVLEQLSKLRVIPVIRTKETENAVTAALWVREAGFRTFEITLTTPGAINIIVQLTAK